VLAQKELREKRIQHIGGKIISSWKSGAISSAFMAWFARIVDQKGLALSISLSLSRSPPPLHLTHVHVCFHRLLFSFALSLSLALSLALFLCPSVYFAASRTRKCTLSNHSHTFALSHIPCLVLSLFVHIIIPSLSMPLPLRPSLLESVCA